MARRTISFRTNLRKALEVVLWCADKGGSVDFHTVLKVLFFADVIHMNRYGRPVVGDDYQAMPYGPVPRTTYDILRGDALLLDILGEREPPFEVRGRFTVVPKRPPDLSLLSESDIEALEGGWAQCAHLGFNRRTELSHEHPAWKRARESGRQLMDYADFLEGENSSAEVIEDVAAIAADLLV